MKINNKILIGIIIFLVIVIIGGIVYINKDNQSIFNLETKNSVIKTPNFTDFYTHMVQSDKSVLENNINLGHYDDRAYYEMFNDLYFKFHEKDSTEIWKCINNKETSECLFYNAVLNNNEELCSQLPIVKNVSYPGKYGDSHFDNYYRSSCLLNVRMLYSYYSQSDKISFCKNFSEKYIQNECLIYTCESYYWDKSKPSECTQENLNSWFGIN